jgi:hypothetical protein
LSWCAVQAWHQAGGAPAAPRGTPPRAPRCRVTLPTPPSPLLPQAAAAGAQDEQVRRVLDGLGVYNEPFRSLLAEAGLRHVWGKHWRPWRKTDPPPPMSDEEVKRAICASECWSWYRATRGGGQRERAAAAQAKMDEAGWGMLRVARR